MDDKMDDDKIGKNIKAGFDLFITSASASRKSGVENIVKELKNIGTDLDPSLRIKRMKKWIESEISRRSKKLEDIKETLKERDKKGELDIGELVSQITLAGLASSEESLIDLLNKCLDEINFFEENKDEMKPEETIHKIISIVEKGLE